MLQDCTLGIIGYGGIGKECARIVSQGFGTRVIGMKRNPATADSEQMEFADEIVDNGRMDYLLEQSDFILNICPLVESTKDIFNKEFFAKMKDTAIFMNIGRGPSVVEEDLIEALKNGTIAGAFLDVFRQEPLPKDSPFWDLPNVYITPHAANLTFDIADRSVATFATNTPLYVAGKELTNVVCKEQGY